jgi:two-component system, NtrC family, sensor kinase
MNKIGKKHNEATEQGHLQMDQVVGTLQENQKLITLGRLTASIVHEINNPLEAITNLLYLMQQSTPAKTAEYLKLAQRELSRVVQISHQTLTFTRETSTPVHVQLAELMDEVLVLHTRRISDKQLSIIRQYETREKVMVFPGEMRQVLANLISNALEATSPRGRIVIRIRSARRWSGRNVRGLRLSIGDNGSGIPAEVSAHLGEPFFTTKGQNGTGLGLWVTRSILKRYGGSLQLRSSVSPARHGTVFSLFLPSSPRPVVVFPGGGDAENFPAAGINSAVRYGLRLIERGNAEVIRIRNYPTDKDDASHEDTSPRPPAGKRLHAHSR